jgi:hypothetical protein
MGQVERKKGATWVQALWQIGDLAAIGGGFLLGYWTRFHSPLTLWFPPDKGIPPPSVYLLGAAITALVWVPLMHAEGLYRVERGRTRHGWGDLLRVQMFGMLIVAALSFFYRGASFSRLAVPLIWFFTLVLTVIGRAAVQRIVGRWSRLRPIRFAVVGSGEPAERLVRSFLQSSYPHEFVGAFVNGETCPSGERRGGIALMPSASLLAPVLGPPSLIRTLAPELRCGLIILAVPEASPALLQEVHAQCQELDLDFLFVPDLASFWGRRMHVEDIDGLPVIRLRDLPLVGWNGVVKRLVDLLAASLLLVLLSPLLLLVALCVRLDSPGPVFYRQERVGRDRRRFRLVKFRSMRVDAESDTGPVWAARGDARRTRIGAFLRRWSLDELPQLWNVLRGSVPVLSAPTSCASSSQAWRTTTTAIG